METPRKNEIITMDAIRSKFVSMYGNPINIHGNPISMCHNPQSKVKKIRRLRLRLFLKLYLTPSKP
jgi:hypothetical protein